MTNTLTAFELRRWAENCDRLAENRLATPEERGRFLKKAAALRELADLQDWLDGSAKSQAA